MPRTLTLLHGADLHVGAPMRGVAHLDERWRRRVLDAMTQATDRLVDAALRNAVDFVVLAGDLFDQAKPSLHDLMRVLAGFGRLEAAGIPVYICGGNHDPFTTWQQERFADVMPSNVRIFEADRPSFFLFERDGEPLCVLAGRSYYSKIWPEDVSIAKGLTRQAAIDALGPEAATAPFGVGVLHTGLDLDTVKAPSSRIELAHAGLDYWALGHIHRRQSDETGAPPLAFSGSIQGRDLREVGRRGVNLVTLSEGAPVVRFVPTAAIALARLRVDVSLCTSIGQIKEKIMAALFTEDGNALCEMMISRITLEGTCALHRALARPETREALRAKVNDAYDEFFCDEIIDETVDPEVAAILASAPSAPERWDANDSFSAGEPARSDFFIGFDEERPDRFSTTLTMMANDQRLHRANEIALLQEELARVGVDLESTDATFVDRLSAEAERLALDLIEAPEDATS